MKQANALSVIGRSGYFTNLLVVPTALALYKLLYVPYKQAQADAAKELARKNMVKPRTVDPDLMNPFTPIPFHNNYELKFMHYHINMRGYLNENGLNCQDYAYKQYHDAYAEDNSHLFNWTSVHGPPGFDQKFRKSS